MGTNSAFDEFQRTVDADAEQVRLARYRRDVFQLTLGRADDVVEVISSGSLRRSTQLKPVHDVDLIVVYDSQAYPTWGLPGGSSEQALVLTQQRVKDKLGNPNGTVEQWVRRADPRDRAVKCFLDDPDDPTGFTVDAMPVLRKPDGTLLIPSKTEDRWITAHPEFLIDLVRRRQQAWPYFRPMVRVLKQWRLGIGAKPAVKSLVMEVLALTCMPECPTSRAVALSRFFTSAAMLVNEPIVDPAGYCGLIQPDLDTATLRTALEQARDLAAEAVLAEEKGEDAYAKTLWRKILGSGFPAPAASTPKLSTLVIPTYTVHDGPQG
ncbi:SMODS domain-containing nucleotidyltransferase [Kutzneria kofuensis]|uniref:Nucleotidyltransferase n=1 Tax=Kutzneria kofuensis TaxID=103725 RepID=A0A7W9KQ52_9PSEU|nr:hypothetical protein [Kutzneria kofuensis]MBB5896683.1 hypothetical protein [Kutzneria kofuensis]